MDQQKLNESKVLVATVWDKRKMYCQRQVMEANFHLSYPNKELYSNCQVTPEEMMEGGWFADPVTYSRYSDVWTINSSWLGAHTTDQDNTTRVPPIVTARNMAIDCAIANKFDYIFFVDADVVVPKDAIQKLLLLKESLCGGLVPGRGAHSHAYYTFGPNPVPMNEFTLAGRFGYRLEGDPIICCDHGTAGCMLVHSGVFDFVRFRYGHSRQFWRRPRPYYEMMAEDACFAEDSEQLHLHRGWRVHGGVRCLHLDDPQNPLTDNNAINSYNTLSESL